MYMNIVYEQDREKCFITSTSLDLLWRSSEAAISYLVSPSDRAHHLSNTHTYMLETFVMFMCNITNKDSRKKSRAPKVH